MRIIFCFIAALHLVRGKEVVDNYEELLSVCKKIFTAVIIFLHVLCSKQGRAAVDKCALPLRNKGQKGETICYSIESRE